MAALANDYSFKQPDSRFHFFLNNLQQRGFAGYKNKRKIKENKKKSRNPGSYASSKDGESFEKESLSLIIVILLLQPFGK